MREFFDWLIKHEKLLFGVTLVLVLTLVAQIKFCKSRVEPGSESGQTASQLEKPSGSIINISGIWEMNLQKRRGGTQTWTLKLEQSGEQLKGVINSEGGDLPVTGTIKGQAIDLSATRFGVTVEFPATLIGDTMTGEMRVLTFKGQWTAKRRA